MNGAALLTFLHPMLSLLVASAYVIYILKKDYAAAVGSIESKAGNETTNIGS